MSCSGNVRRADGKEIRILSIFLASFTSTTVSLINFFPFLIAKTKDFKLCVRNFKQSYPLQRSIKFCITNWTFFRIYLYVHQKGGGWRYLHKKDLKLSWLQCSIADMGSDFINVLPISHGWEKNVFILMNWRLCLCKTIQSHRSCNRRKRSIFDWIEMGNQMCNLNEEFHLIEDWTACVCLRKLNLISNNVKYFEWKPGIKIGYVAFRELPCYFYVWELNKLSIEVL